MQAGSWRIMWGLLAQTCWPQALSQTAVTGDTDDTTFRKLLIRGDIALLSGETGCVYAAKGMS